MSFFRSFLLVDPILSRDWAEPAFIHEISGLDGARPIDTESQVVSPVDGTVGQIGTVRNGYMIQAKDHTYTVSQLLGGEQELADYFQSGKYVTKYSDK